MQDTSLSPAVIALLNDTTDTPEVISEASRDDIQYKECLKLLITGNPQECLERLAVYYDPLEDYVSLSPSSSGENSFDQRVFEPFIRSCDELTRMDDSVSLSASVRRAIGTVLDGRNYEGHLTRLVESGKSHDDELRFLQKYFNGCIIMATRLYDGEKRSSLLKIVEEQLVKVIDKFSNLGNLNNVNKSTTLGDRVAKSESDSPNVQQLQGLVAVYLFRFKVETQHCAKSEKLYWDLCNRAPHLQSLLSSSLMDNTESYQNGLLNLLRPEHQMELASTGTDHNNQPPKASTQLGDTPAEDSQALIKRYNNPGTAGTTDIYQLLRTRWSTVTKLLFRIPGILRRHPTLITLLTGIAVAIVTVTVRKNKLTRHRGHYWAQIS